MGNVRARTARKYTLLAREATWPTGKCEKEAPVLQRQPPFPRQSAVHDCCLRQKRDGEGSGSRSCEGSVDGDLQGCPPLHPFSNRGRAGFLQGAKDRLPAYFSR